MHVQAYEDFPLTKELAGEGLSLLCKTGNGLAHAYVRMDLRDKGLTDVGVLNCFVHIRYMVSLPLALWGFHGK